MYNMNRKVTYRQSGVDYNAMDFLKRLAQNEGKKTASNLAIGLRELPSSRGESAYVLEMNDRYLAFVEEGLGTKNLVADAMSKVTGKTYYNAIAQDTVAMMVNDVITVGAKPVTILAYWAAGRSNWFENKQRMKDLVRGWGIACDIAGATWGGGETPTLKGVIEPEAIDLAGACFGMIKPKSHLTLGDKLKEGDVIVLFASSGIHANGLTLARTLANKLPHGYQTKLPSGKTYGEALLAPTFIYSRLIEDLFTHQVDVHYMVNITGHGWRKLMRYSKPFTYRIHTLPPVPEVLQFLVKEAPVDVKEAYGNLNMGAGFAIFVPLDDADKVVRLSRKQKIEAYIVGTVEKGIKQVVIEPLSIIYSENTLKVRT